MKRGQLRDHFVGAGAKRLSAIDADSEKWNQHDIGTTREMRDKFLGETHKQRYTVQYIWLGGDQEGDSVEGTRSGPGWDAAMSCGRCLIRSSTTVFPAANL